MKSTVPAIALALGLSIGTISAGAQQERQSRQEDRRDAERLRRQNEAQRRQFEEMNRANQRRIDEMNAAFFAGIEEAPRVRLRFFLDEIQKFTLQIEELYYASLSEDWSQEELDQRSQDIEDTTDRLRDFVNFQTEPPLINVAPVPEESVPHRINRLVNLSQRLIPNIIALAVGSTVGLDLLNQVRDDLAITEALSRAYQELEF